MRIALIAGVSCAALVAAPALAQDQSNAALQARLDALEVRVGTLERRNAELERQLAASSPAPAPAVAQTAPPSPPPATASVVEPAQWTIVPKFTSPNGAFSFKPRGALDVDYAAFNERRGGYDYNNGTQIRRGRFGFDGTAFRQFAWRIEGEWVDNKASLLDAYVAYTGIKDVTVTLGQLKVPAGLEANTSDSFNEFIERGMANTAFGAVGGERRVGLTLAYADKLLTATGGLYGAGEAVDRNPATPDEVWGVNGRVTLEPVNRPGRLIHLGASAWRVKDLADNSVILGDRPNVRVDGGYLERIAIARSNPEGGPETGVKTASFYGLEGAGVLGPFSVQGEYSRLHLDRFADAPSLNFDGYYVFGSAFLTGESRRFKGGTVDRVEPIRPFDPARGHWGALELALRYDRLNLTDRAFSPLDHDAHSWTAALNWYLTGNIKLLFNYIRFTGENSPLVATPAAVYGTTAKGDAFATRLHLDF